MKCFKRLAYPSYHRQYSIGVAVLRVLLCYILAGSVAPKGYALSLSDLVPFAQESTFNIYLDNNLPLRTLLEDELALQRETNSQLKQFTKQNKVARFESQLLIARLHAEGYYAADVRFNLKDEKINYHIETGALYHIQTLSFRLPQSLQIPAETIALKAGDRLHAGNVLAAQKKLADYVSANSCFYHVNTDYRVVIDHQSHSAAITLIVADSPQVTFGDVNIAGLKTIEEDYLLARLNLKKGECFKRNNLDNARLTLIQTNLLVSANAVVHPLENNAVPITFNVIERQHRTLSAGISFESSEGFGLSAGWEHRNFMRRAQKLSLDTHIAQNAQTLSANLTLPHFHRSNQAFVVYADFSNKEYDAYESKTGTLGAEISRQFKPHLRGLVGTELAFSEVEEDGLEDNFALLSLPLGLAYDKRNNALDPRDGWVASARIQPYWDAYDTSTQFVKSTLAASGYLSFDSLAWRPTLAARGAIGIISGIDREQVPANVRFYAGGGGSVRGYAFQTLGSLTDNEPNGGLSLTEISFETRVQWSQHWGGALFLDGGFAYAATTPQLNEKLLWGAGVGLRYFTSFAPIRFDIAAPLDKRDEIDDDFQLYISIGQAF